MANINALLARDEEKDKDSNLIINSTERLNFILPPIFDQLEKRGLSPDQARKLKELRSMLRQVTNDWRKIQSMDFDSLNAAMVQIKNSKIIPQLINVLKSFKSTFGDVQELKAFDAFIQRGNALTAGPKPAAVGGVKKKATPAPVRPLPLRPLLTEVITSSFQGNIDDCFKAVSEFSEARKSSLKHFLRDKYYANPSEPKSKSAKIQRSGDFIVLLSLLGTEPLTKAAVDTFAESVYGHRDKVPANVTGEQLKLACLLQLKQRSYDTLYKNIGSKSRFSNVITSFILPTITGIEIELQKKWLHCQTPFINKASKNWLMLNSTLIAGCMPCH